MNKITFFLIYLLSIYCTNNSLAANDKDISSSLNNDPPSSQEIEKVDAKPFMQTKVHVDNFLIRYNKGIELNNEGLQLYKDKKYNESITKYDEAIKFYNNPIFYSNKAQPYLALKEYDKATETCEQALKINPQCIEAKSNKGAILVNQAMHLYNEGKKEEALDKYSAGLHILTNMLEFLMTKKEAYSFALAEMREIGGSELVEAWLKKNREKK